MRTDSWNCSLTWFACHGNSTLILIHTCTCAHTQAQVKKNTPSVLIRWGKFCLFFMSSLRFISKCLLVNNVGLRLQNFFKKCSQVASKCFQFMKTITLCAPCVPTLITSSCLRDLKNQFHQTKAVLKKSAVTVLTDNTPFSFWVIAWLRTLFSGD